MIETLLWVLFIVFLILYALMLTGIQHMRNLEEKDKEDL